MKVLLSVFIVMTQAYAAEKIHCEEYLNPIPALNPAKNEIYYKTYGNPKNPPLVLIHGLGGSGESWSLLAPLLAHRFHVIIYDQRGHGRSKAAGFNYGTRTFARDLNALLTYLNLKKVHILGASLGARTAVRFADLYPEKVSSLILEDMDLLPRAPATKSSYDRNILLAKHLNEELKSKNFYDLEAYQKFLELYFPWGMDRVADPEVLTRDDHGYIQTIGIDLVAFLLSSTQPLAEGMNQALSGIQVPTLFLRSDPKAGWSAMSDAGVKAIRAANPKIKVQIIKDADHSIHHMQPKRFLDAVLKFHFSE